MNQTQTPVERSVRERIKDRLSMIVKEEVYVDMDVENLIRLIREVCESVIGSLETGEGDLFNHNIKKQLRQQQSQHGQQHGQQSQHGQQQSQQGQHGQQHGQQGQHGQHGQHGQQQSQQ